MLDADDAVLNSKEVAEILDLSPDTVNELARKSVLPAFKKGRQWRFRKGDLDAWLETERRGVRLSSALPQSASRTEAPRVLVADDEESIRELLARTLALAEYDVETVGDARAALDRLRMADYDLLIADLRMPGMDGLLLVREARRMHPTLSVIIITGYSTEASAIEAVNLGVVGYLVKPFRVPQVLSAVARALGDRQ